MFILESFVVYCAALSFLRRFRFENHSRMGMYMQAA